VKVGMADIKQQEASVADPKARVLSTSSSGEDNDGMKIVVSKDGPYVVSGNIPLNMQIITPNKEGLSWEWKEEGNKSFETGSSPNYSLCRCGRSKNKPFCDGTHAKIGFQGKETATRRPYARQAETYAGPSLTLSDAESLCAFARFCDPGGQIWNLVEQEGEDARKLTIREANHCPAGRLVVQDKTGKAIENHLPKSIGVVEDPALGCSGPLWVRGGIRIESEDGRPYEIRNRVTLCRCGASNNMPFCNGSHASIRFRDGLVEFVRVKTSE
jgi:CDGSH-type Zn-finger protein